MFRQFLFHSPAWAGVEGYFDAPETDWFLFRHGEYQGGKHRRGHRRPESFDRSWGDESRTRRGDIKFILLEMLSDASSHGYDLIKAMESRYGGFRRLSPGSVYPTLQMLEEGGYLTSEDIEGKRVYTITENGRQLLSDRTQQSEARRDRNFTDRKPSELIELRRRLTEVNDAVTQVARSGKPEQANRVRDLLVQVKQEIYKLLSEQ